MNEDVTASPQEEAPASPPSAPSSPERNTLSISSLQKKKMFVLGALLILLLASSLLFVQHTQKETSPLPPPTITKKPTPTGRTPSPTPTGASVSSSSTPTTQVNTPTPVKTGIMGFTLSESQVNKNIKPGACTFALNVTSTGSTHFHFQEPTFWNNYISWKESSGVLKKGETFPMEVCLSKDTQHGQGKYSSGAGDRITFYDDTTGATWGIFLSVSVEE